MSDKPIAGLVAAALVAPLCAVCIFGLAALASALGWFAAEIGGFGVWTTAPKGKVGLVQDPTKDQQDLRDRHESPT